MTNNGTAPPDTAYVLIDLHELDVCASCRTRLEECDCPRHHVDAPTIRWYCPPCADRLMQDLRKVGSPLTILPYPAS